MKTKFFDLAKKVSRFSDHPQHKLGTVIVSGNRIVSLGFNKNKTNTKSNTAFKAHHSELDAILKSNRDDLRGCDLYIFRETKTGNLGNSKPCIYCQELIKKVKINRVFYTTPEGYKEEVFV